MVNRNSHKGGGGNSGWRAISLCMLLVLVPWALYVNIHPSNQNDLGSLSGVQSAQFLGQIKGIKDLYFGTNKSEDSPKVVHINQAENLKKVANTKAFKLPDLPVLGPVPTDGVVPLFGVQHKGTDAIFALACNYPKIYYQRFVGSLRKAGYEDDIVLAVSPIEKMKPGVQQYIKDTKVVAYGFDVDCQGPDNCKLKDDFLGYPDPRPHRTFANIRYALYEYWMRVGKYDGRSYILILDFRDTFFQLNPFAGFGDFQTRSPYKYDLQLYAENWKVKTIGICVFNSMWVSKCFGKAALGPIRDQAVICSGSTLGSSLAITHYLRTMLQSMDTVKCWLKGIESDQGYQNYLFYNGHFNTELGNATLYYQVIIILINHYY